MVPLPYRHLYNTTLWIPVTLVASGSLLVHDDRWHRIEVEDIRGFHQRLV